VANLKKKNYCNALWYGNFEMRKVLKEKIGGMI